MASLRPILPLDNDQLESLFPGRLVTGEQIDSYFRLIERRSLFHNELPSVFAFDSYFFPAWEKGGYNLVKGRAKNVNLFSKEILLFPVHIPPPINGIGHWALIVVKPKLQLIRTLDSLGNSQTKYMEIVKKFMTAEAAQKKVLIHEDIWLICGNPEGCPRQTNGVDCGVFTCFFAEVVSLNEAVVGALMEPLIWRKHIARALRRGKIGEEAFPLFEPVGVTARKPSKDSKSLPDLDDVLLEAIDNALKEFGEPAGEEAIDKALKEFGEPAGEEVINNAITAFDEPAEEVRPISPCLSLAASESWEFLDPRRDTEDNDVEASKRPETFLSTELPKPEEGKKETGEVMQLEPSQEERGAAFPKLSKKGKVWKEKRPRHPKRVRIYREDGSFFRVNVKNAGQYGYVPKM